jgi:hypothetical protein
MELTDSLAMLPQPLSCACAVLVPASPVLHPLQLDPRDVRKDLQRLPPVLIIKNQILVENQTNNAASSLGQPLPNLVGRAPDGSWYMNVDVGHSGSLGQAAEDLAGLAQCCSAS